MQKIIKSLKKPIYKVLWRNFGLHIYNIVYNIVYRLLHPPKKTKYYPISKRRRREPVDPWAYVRAKNEARTIEASLNSILPVIKKGVIGYNPSDDETEEFIIDFCKKNPGFIPFKYDYDVIPYHDLRYKEGGYDPKRGVDAYYNAVFDKIPNGEWFIKIDPDHIYDTEKLEQLLYLPKNDKDCIILSRINLHYNQDKLFFLRNKTFMERGDHWLVKKNNHMKFELLKGDLSDGDVAKKEGFCCWEVLPIFNMKLNLIKTDLMNWHFPLIKSLRCNLEVDLVPFKDNKYRKMFRESKYHIPKDMLDEKRIMKYTKQFKI